MRPESRAIVFDLDDTLFNTRRYTCSAFAAVAAHLARRCGLNRARTIAILRSALDADGGPGLECDRLIAACGLPAEWLPELVAVARGHQPALRLPVVSSRVLATLRPSWKIGILTNGVPAVQAAKVRALALAARVDAVVYASEHGTGVGKPEREPFDEVSKRLGVEPSRTVFVGDDEVRDVAGASAVGMRTIRSIAWTHRQSPPPDTRADALVRSLGAVPRAADSLLRKAAGHAA
jgi:putative hydrolase of the HAD superfamily